MPTLISLYSRSGVKLIDILGHAIMSWELNGIGQAKIVIPKNSGLTEEQLQFCNGILIRTDVAGDWGGELYTPRDWDSDTWTLTAYTAEHRLRRRVAPVTSYTGTAGTIFGSIIADASAGEDTGIDLFSSFSGGDSWEEPTNATLYDILVRIQNQSGQDWRFTPVLNASNQLRFDGYWYERRGTDWSFALEEGVNLEDSIKLSEQGEIINSFTLRDYTSDTADAIVSDSESQITFGLSESLQSSSIPVGLSAASYASILLEERKVPRRTYELVAVNINNTFDHLGIGDTLNLKTRRYGWTGSQLGMETRVRIIAKEFNEEAGTMQLSVNEVTT